LTQLNDALDESQALTETMANNSSGMWHELLELLYGSRGVWTKYKPKDLTGKKQTTKLKQNIVHPIKKMSTTVLRMLLNLVSNSLLLWKASTSSLWRMTSFATRCRSSRQRKRLLMPPCRPT
ncbi:MAG: hypothetical protein ACRDL7_06485, partial [Gaiellaceae bacterium]